MIEAIAGEGLSAGLTNPIETGWEVPMKVWTALKTLA
jgi:hypothetical protein